MSRFHNSELQFLGTILFLTILNLIHCTNGIQLVSSSYQIKQANFLGNQYEYAMFEAQYDEDLYLKRQWPCPCVNQTIQCYSNESSVPSAPVNEAGFQLTSLKLDQWYYGIIDTNFGTQYFKFVLDYDPTNPCPILQFQFQSDIGSLSAYISTSTIPSKSDFDWYHPYYSFSTYSICSFHKNFVYGPYYVFLINEASNVANSFKVRFSTIESPECIVTNAGIDYSSIIDPPSTIGAEVTAPEWIDDGIVVLGNADNYAYGDYLYYKLFAPLVYFPSIDSYCTNISVGSYRTFVPGETDLFVSVFDPNPTMSGQNYNFFSTMDGDDYVNSYYCAPSGQQKTIKTSTNQNTSYVVFYIGMRSWSVITYGLIATINQYEPEYPITDLPFAQFRFDMVMGAFPSLSCGMTSYSCHFNPYLSCASDLYDCCYLFDVSPATETPQALWPWSEEDTSIGTFYTEIFWNDSLPIVPGKLSWQLKLSTSTSTNQTTYYSYDDPSTCIVTMGGKLVGPNGSLLPSLQVSFPNQKTTTCNLDSYNNVVSDIQAITSLMGNSQYETVADLASLQIDLNLLAWQDNLGACEDVVTSQLIQKSQKQKVIEDVQLCQHQRYSAAWYADPCCSVQAWRTSACIPTSVTVSTTVYDSPDDTKIGQICSNQLCTEGTVSSLISSINSISSPSQGCQASFESTSSLSITEDIVAFADNCRIAVAGTDLLGAPCTMDSQCFNLSTMTCNLTLQRCTYTNEDLIWCLTNSIDTTTARMLYNLWDVQAPVSPRVTFQELQTNILRQQCSGPTALQYRAGYIFTVQETSCSDTCLQLNLQPFCFDFTSPSCTIPDICNAAINYNACYRIWAPVQTDLVECINSKVCNWQNSTFNPCPPGTSSSDCEKSCMHSSNATYTCLDCTQARDGQCMEVAGITNATQCNIGYCPTDLTITDAGACALTGTCSIPCATCNNITGCTAAGQCSSILEFQPFMELLPNQTGACVYPSPWTIDFGYACIGASDVLTSIGCANATVYNVGDCDSIGMPNFWYEFPYTEADCMNETGYGCYYSNSGIWIPRNQSQCTIDPLATWEPYYTWDSGVWTPASFIQSTWQPRTYSSQNSIQSSVSFPLLSSQLENAVALVVSPSFQTEALCRYGTNLNLFASASCDCGYQTTLGSSGSDSCFTQTKNAEVAIGNACLYLNSVVNSLFGYVEVGDYVVDPSSASGGDFCHSVYIGYTPASEYALPPNAKISTKLISGSSSNKYWVVDNNQNASIGQILSPALTVNFDFGTLSPLTLCVQVDSSISVENIVNSFTLAFLNSNSRVQAFSPSTQVQLVGPFTSVETTDKAAAIKRSSTTHASVSLPAYICAPITSSGTYFAAGVVNDYENQTNRVSVVQYYVGAAIYLCLLFFVILQTILLILDSRNQKILKLKLTFLAIIGINSIIRTVYVLLPSNAFGYGLDSIQFIIFELPTFLFFSVFTAIAYLWLVVVLRTYYLGSRGSKAREAQLLRFFVIGNCMMYFIFALFIFLIAIVPTLQKQSPCFYGNLATTSNAASYDINLAYWIFQQVISVILTVSLSIAVVLLLKTIVTVRFNMKSSQLKKRSKTNAERQIFMITAVAVVCVVFLLIRAATFLWAAASQNVINVVVFVVLECIPQAMLAGYLQPFRCFGEKSYSSSQSGSRNSSPNSKRGCFLSQGDASPHNIHSAHSRTSTP